MAIDTEAECSDVTRLAKIKSGECLVIAAVTARVDDEQRLAVPAIEEIGANVRLRHCWQWMRDESGNYAWAHSST
jgi:hypothetical protein